MNIVIVDSYTLNPGDLSWHTLNSLGNLTIYNRTAKELILERSAKAEIILTNKTPLEAATINKLPNLKYIGVLATGFNIVDVIAAKVKNIPVCNVPAYGTNSVAQMVFAHILNITQHVGLHNDSVMSGEWTNSADWCYWKKPLIELVGMKLGIIGYGRIGQQVAKIGLALGMEILIHTLQHVDTLPENCLVVNRKALFEQSDIISLHCPLNNKTENIINSTTLKIMKSSAILINTSRGQLIDEAALADALNHDEIAAAGLDVLSVEPAQPDNSLVTAKNCFITPHIAWATKNARQRLLDIAVSNVQAYLNGEIRNCVNL